ncbi:MAG TPA: glutathione S-transferase [Pusillimonas sp.]|uniref:glutathione S-transferase n=1 Tax=Pusillimonas sp. TaxID=3040095 RepID=UPI002B4B3261|nr:glutathione S-transferase [Pusillimonas sp.]HLU19038.1 glutathione S-transferase [Pusillimonas sp.]
MPDFLDLPKLYSFRRCPYAMRARLALAVSGQKCELREVVLRNKPQELIQASPKATVPVLVLPDSTVLEQSLDIMLWSLRRHDPENWLAPETGDLSAMLALIQECDEQFKPRLDRYKYPGRFLDKPQEQHNWPLDDPAGFSQFNRDTGATWLHSLEVRLNNSLWLSGSRRTLADMAIAPFVRQFAHVDKEWFAAQPWPALQAWLTRWMESELFARVMKKYPPWTPDSPGELFP